MLHSVDTEIDITTRSEYKQADEHFFICILCTNIVNTKCYIYFCIEYIFV